MERNERRWFGADANPEASANTTLLSESLITWISYKADPVIITVVAARLSDARTARVLVPATAHSSQRNVISPA
jgi:hypothetical protein